MIWKECVLLSEEKTGEDKLGNAIYETVEAGRTMARYTPWTDEQIAFEGREVTRNEQRFIIPMAHENFPKCQKVRMDGHELEVTKDIDAGPRFTIIQVKVYKE